ncbi:hypothetical protein Ahy_B01g053507 [Arachis hypogaea]|uniref:Uncharacterized protein n=1 Tax=Arachis hypogaea TaxID=3818 RepID=A0A445ARX0_ARAHY|nr:hypothetical protein Ahy_B01g053507 [Arachis hypogaea]
MLKKHRKLSMSVCHIIENNEEAGIRPSKIYQSFVAAAGCHHELNFIEKDMRNYITIEVGNVSELEDAKEFGKYLLRMKEKNQNFFFELKLEDDQSIKIAFWADARSRAACEYFGNVISFDTTHNTNRYNLVFGSFVGMNHHGNALKGIFTDQCISMQRAIEACMPATIHRWCIWYIIMKITSKLNGYKRHQEIEQEMIHVVWNSLTKESFDRNWNDFLMKYGLGDNKWLSGSREQKERESDAADFHTIIPCATKSSIKAHFQHVYTHDKFRKVQAQFREKSKNVKRRHTHIKSSYDELLLEPRSKRFDELVFHLQNICKFASILHRAYDNAMVEMQEHKVKRNKKCSLSHEDANLEAINELQSPPRARTRGRPKNRLGSKMEK